MNDPIRLTVLISASLLLLTLLVLYLAGIHVQFVVQQGRAESGKWNFSISFCVPLGLQQIIGYVFKGSREDRLGRIHQRIKQLNLKERVEFEKFLDSLPESPRKKKDK